MLHNLRFFSLQNAVYFIMLPCLVPVLLAVYLQHVLKFKCKILIFIQQIYILNILNMLHNLRFFSLQNAVYFIMLPCLVPVLLAVYLQGVLKFKCKIPAPKG